MIQGAMISRPVVSRHGIFFWLLGTLVKVRYTFFLTSVLLGLRLRSFVPVLVWIVVMFVAILVHELGHAMAARFYRQNPQIELHTMGGVTKWTWEAELRWYERVIISLAGPASGFVIGGLLYLSEAWIPFRESYVLWMAKEFFLWVTLGWGVFNLLPVMPLDGGQAMDEVLEHVLGGDRGRSLARKISIVFGFTGVAVGIYLDHIWAALLLGLFAYNNLQRLRGLPGVQLPG